MAKAKRNPARKRTLHLDLPDALREAAERSARAAGESVTVWVSRLIAAETGVAFEPRGRGRPTKTDATS